MKKTVRDAVEQYNGVWPKNDCNAMAFLMGDIDYCSIDDSGQLYHGDVNDLGEPMCDNWQLVCTRAQFEAEAEVWRRERENMAAMNVTPANIPLKTSVNWQSMNWGVKPGSEKHDFLEDFKSAYENGFPCIDAMAKFMYEIGYRKPKTDKQKWLQSCQRTCESMGVGAPATEQLEVIWDGGLGKWEDVE